MSDKKNYFNAKIYKSIVLLDTLSKILKFIIFERLQNIIQMRIYKQKLTDTTLQLITEKIHIVWSDIRRKVISLLSLNEKSAFNNVVHSKLLHDIKKKSSQTASQICEELFEKLMHHDHNQWLHDDEMQHERWHITKFFTIINIIFVLQRELVKSMWWHQIKNKLYKFYKRHQYFNIWEVHEVQLQSS